MAERVGELIVHLFRFAPKGHPREDAQHAEHERYDRENSGNPEGVGRPPEGERPASQEGDELEQHLQLADPRGLILLLLFRFLVRDEEVEGSAHECTEDLERHQRHDEPPRYDPLDCEHKEGR